MDDATEKLIEQYRERISVAKDEIKNCQDRIDTLEGLTEQCPQCHGFRRVEIGHSFRDGTKYMPCYLCNGRGKLTKERAQEYSK